jgi:RNA-directed DNA polymerase
VQRLKNKVAAILVPGVMGTWDGVRDTPNRLMRGWCGYFSPGSHYASDRVIEAYLDDRVRNLRGASDAASPIPLRITREIAASLRS